VGDPWPGEVRLIDAGLGPRDDVAEAGIARRALKDAAPRVA